MEKKWYGWKELKYGSIPHEIVAEDMSNAKFADCYHTALFFYLTFKSLIKDMKDYMVQEMMEKGIVEDIAVDIVADLLKIMDGFMLPKQYQRLKERLLQIHLN